MAGAASVPIFNINDVAPYVDHGDNFVRVDFPDAFDESGLDFCHEEYRYVMGWLHLNRGSNATLKNYIKEMERYVAWCWQYKGMSIFGPKLRGGALRIAHGNEYIEFMVNPPPQWISSHTHSKFDKKGKPNPRWRPFFAKGGNYRASDQALTIAFSILSSFYKYAIADGRTSASPFASIKQIKGLVRVQRHNAPIMKITDIQWQYLIETAIKLADQQPEPYERTLFIISFMLSNYLRVSDFVPIVDAYRHEEVIPRMNDIKRVDGKWEFWVLGKGNVESRLPISDAMLDALKRWRKHLGLSALPTPDDDSYLIPARRGNAPIRSTNQIRNIVNELFEKASDAMKKDGLDEDAAELDACTAHWMRHTGISRDIEFRPREHVQKDARHSSYQTTDKYVETGFRERAESNQHKKLIPDLD